MYFNIYNSAGQLRASSQNMALASGGSQTLSFNPTVTERLRAEVRIGSRSTERDRVIPTFELQTTGSSAQTLEVLEEFEYHMP